MTTTAARQRCGSWELTAITDIDGAVLSTMEAVQCPNTATHEITSTCVGCGRTVTADACRDHLAPESCFCGRATAITDTREASG